MRSKAKRGISVNVERGKVREFCKNLEEWYPTLHVGTSKDGATRIPSIHAPSVFIEVKDHEAEGVSLWWSTESYRTSIVRCLNSYGYTGIKNEIDRMFPELGKEAMTVKSKRLMVMFKTPKEGEVLRQAAKAYGMTVRLKPPHREHRYLRWEGDSQGTMVPNGGSPASVHANSPTGSVLHWPDNAAEIFKQFDHMMEKPVVQLGRIGQNEVTYDPAEHTISWGVHSIKRSEFMSLMGAYKTPMGVTYTDTRTGDRVDDTCGPTGLYIGCTTFKFRDMVDILDKVKDIV